MTGPWIPLAGAEGLRERLKNTVARPAGAFYKIRNAAADEAELLLYDDIGGWFGTYADEFVADLKGITAPKLTVRVNSPGGSVFEGIAIANALRAHPADVTVQVDGLAASIASVIAMAGNRLVMMPNSTLMIHDASGMCMGDAADMAKMGEVLDLLSNNIADVYAAKAGGTREEWRARMQAESWYLPAEAVAAGLADAIVQASGAGAADDPEMHAAWDLSADRYAGREEAPEPLAKGGVVSDMKPIGEDTPVEVFPATALAADKRAALSAQIAEVLGAPAAADDTTAPADAEAGPADEWAALTAGLTIAAPVDWLTLTAHLTTDTSSCAATSSNA